MKKRLGVAALVVGAALPLLSTPALARDGDWDRRDRYYDGDRNRHREREWREHQHREHERREREFREERRREYFRREYREPYYNEYRGNGYYDPYGVWRPY